jgi:hypothetical protein
MTSWNPLNWGKDEYNVDYPDFGQLSEMAGGERASWSPLQGQEPDYRVDTVKDASGNPVANPDGSLQYRTVQVGWKKTGSPWGAPQTYMDEAKYGYAPQRNSLQWARNMQADARGAEQQQLQALQSRASGQDSVARMAGQKALGDLQGAIASQYAAGGRRSPAARRAAMYNLASAGQDMASKRMMAESQERLDAQKAAYDAASKMRGEDQGQFGKESDWWKQQQDAQRDEQLVKEKFMSLGFSDKEAERKARMAYLEMMLDAGLKDKQLEYGREAGYMGQPGPVAGTVNLGSRALQAYFSMGTSEAKKAASSE